MGHRWQQKDTERIQKKHSRGNAFPLMQDISGYNPSSFVSFLHFTAYNRTYQNLFACNKWEQEQSGFVIFSALHSEMNSKSALAPRVTFFYGHLPFLHVTFGSLNCQACQWFFIYRTLDSIRKEKLTLFHTGF